MEPVLGTMPSLFETYGLVRLYLNFLVKQGDDGRDAEGTIDPEDQSATRIVTRPSRPSRHVHVQVIPFSWMISLFITIPKEKNPSPIVPKFLPKDVAH